MATHLPSLPQQDVLGGAVATNFSCDSTDSIAAVVFPGLVRTESAAAATRRGSLGSTSVGAGSLTKQSRRRLLLGKLAGPRENAKRLLRLAPSVSSSFPLPQPVARPGPRSDRPRPFSELIISPSDAQMLATAQPPGDGDMQSMISTPASGSVPAAVVQATAPATTQSPVPATTTTAPFPSLVHEKIVATGSGISVGIALTEPVLFLAGYDQNDPSTKKPAILRGQLHLKITKCVKIKKISICFRGHSQTEWPDGIPPKKVQFHDRKDLVTQGVVYFNHGDTALMQNDYGAHYYRYSNKHGSVATLKDGVSSTTRELFSKGPSSTSLNGAQLTAKELKRLSLQSNQSRSFGKREASPDSGAQPQRNYRMFPAGDYLYSFEFPVDGSLPETIKTDLGYVRYELEAIVERSGAFRPNLLGSLEVPVVRTPAEGSLEQVEPIAISRNWEDQLHYDIVISGKSFPLGSQVPIAFKLTPLAKVECHRIKVFVTENVQHWTADKSVHRLQQPAKKVLLFEKRADSTSVSTYPGSSMRVTAGGGIAWDQREAAARGEELVDRHRTNLLGDLTNDTGVGPTEMEFNVQLPSCPEMKLREESQRLHFDTTYEHIQISHWIKIVLRLSKVDENDPTRRRHFEISIDSPFHILSCKATQGNIFLPAYTSPNSDPATPAQEYECGCPGAASLRRDGQGGNPQAIAIRDLTCATTVDRSSSSSTDSTPSGRGVTRSFTNGSAGLARPPQAHLAGEHHELVRPIHLLRAPSFAPPAFDEMEPPPPLVTPPPEYTSIVGDHDRETVLEDYFQRLSYYEEEHEDDRGLGRVDIPLTPGRRVNRSMDVPREWIRLDGLNGAAVQ